MTHEGVATANEAIWQTTLSNHFCWDGRSNCIIRPYVRQAAGSARSKLRAFVQYQSDF